MINRKSLSVITGLISIVFSSILLFYELALLGVEYITTTLLLLTSISLVYVLYRVIESKAERKQLAGIEEVDKYPIICENISKEVRILNDSGDATVTYSYDCRNNSSEFLRQVIHTAAHDGNLEKVRVLVNQRPAGVDIEHFVRERLETREPLPIVPYTIKIRINLAEERIPPLGRFNYIIEYKFKRAYPRLFERTAEFTAITVEQPTARLLFSLESPIGIRFEPESIDIEIDDRLEVANIDEKKRILKECPPLVKSDRRIVLWDIFRPKLATKYRLFFQVSRSEKK